MGRVFMTTDRIFADVIQKPADFVFDERVAAVFPDMLQRSIPGYPAIIRMIETLTARYAQPGSNLYDLGCSLGASSLAMQKGLLVDDCTIVGIDNSAAMIKRCRKIESRPGDRARMEFICEDIALTDIRNASVVVMNFTLQFVDPAPRSALLQKISAGMLPGGILVLSEKVVFADQQVNELLIDVYHAFKRANGYSDLEISQKRSALENVLIPETIDAHEKRLLGAGFSSASVWFQCFNFMSMLAIK